MHQGLASPTGECLAVCIVGQASRTEIQSKVLNLFEPLSRDICVDVFLVMQMQSFYFVNESARQYKSDCKSGETAESLTNQLKPLYRAGRFIDTPSLLQTVLPFPVQILPNIQDWGNWEEKVGVAKSASLASHFQQWSNLNACAELVMEEERLTGRKYKGVLKLRDNTLVLRPVTLSELHLASHRVLVKDCGSWGGVADKVVYSPRALLSEAFQSLWIRAQEIQARDPNRLREVQQVRNPETFTAYVWRSMNVSWLSVPPGVLPLVDGRCMGTALDATRIYCVVSEMKDCRPHRSHLGHLHIEECPAAAPTHPKRRRLPELSLHLHNMSGSEPTSTSANQ